MFFQDSQLTAKHKKQYNISKCGPLGWLLFTMKEMGAKRTDGSFQEVKGLKKAK